MKLLSVVGARPQFIKLATVARALQARRNAGDTVEHRILHTGQHYDEGMSDVFFTEMEIPQPHINLGIQSGNHGDMTGRMLQAIEPVLEQERPNAVIVYGDTNSTLAGALAAAKLSCPIAHIEAGLRSYNRRMPEEINRVLVDHVSDWLLCPTRQAVDNLAKEGLSGKRVVQVGDVMLDAVLHYGQRPEVTREAEELAQRYPDGFHLATVHRAENTDDAARLRAVVAALDALARRHPVVWPVHPRTRQALERHGIRPEFTWLIEPVGYFEMLALLTTCRTVLTDSGGLQKEAFFMGKRCVTLRDETEWVELVRCGWNVIAGADTTRIIESVEAFQQAASQPAGEAALYGTGNASEKIAALLVEGYA